MHKSSQHFISFKEYVANDASYRANMQEAWQMYCLDRELFNKQHH